jgi:hypothetical protein
MTQQLPVHGQGIFVFRQINKNQPCSFRFTNPDGNTGLHIEFTETQVTVHDIASLKPHSDPTNKSGLLKLAGAYYWFSLDAQNQRLYAGVGESRLETVIYTYNYDLHSHAATKLFLESLTQVQGVCNVAPIRIIKDPVTDNVPLIVKDTDELCMEHIASAKYMPKANLSSIAQKLYHCIAGKKFTLNTHDFPDFAAAIEYSIRTPGMWCYNKLRDKSREFNPDKPNLAETYLRITLGQNNGESPGVPYVMEIWPVGHYSPIHSHSNANAIIRVLNGSINVSLFPFLCNEAGGVLPFGVANFKEGEITWISPSLNQTHQLRNLESSAKTCITIQCYMYNTVDNRHYDYFDYLDDNGQTQLYEPDSDMDFIVFKQKMLEEWSARSTPTVSSKGCFCWK